MFGPFVPLGWYVNQIVKSFQYFFVDRPFEGDDLLKKH